MKCPYLLNNQCPILKNDLNNLHICEGYICDKPSYVYVVRCKDNTFYTGSTRNLKQRINQHKTKKGAKWIKAHGFREYTYIQCGDYGDAKKIELKIKKWKPPKKAKLFEMYGIYQ